MPQHIRVSRGMADILAPLRDLSMDEVVRRMPYVTPGATAALRQMGNDKYKRGEFNAALHHYTCALANARSFEQKGECASLLSNRSATFLALGHAELALDDARGSLACDETFKKAWLRAAKALLQLRRPTDAIAAMRRTGDETLIAKAIKEAESLRFSPIIDVTDGAPVPDPEACPLLRVADTENQLTVSICAHLDLASRGRFAKVCRSFRDATAEPSLWRTLDLRPLRRQITAEQVVSLCRRAHGVSGGVQVLILDGCRRAAINGRVFSLLADLAEEANAEDGALRALRVLSVRELGTISHHAGLRPTLTTNLQTCVLFGEEGLEDDSAVLTPLESSAWHMDVDTCRDLALREYYLGHLLLSLPAHSLTSFDASFTPWVSDYLLPVLATHARSLTILKLRGCDTNDCSPPIFSHAQHEQYEVHQDAYIQSWAPWLDADSAKFYEPLMSGAGPLHPGLAVCIRLFKQLEVLDVSLWPYYRMRAFGNVGDGTIHACESLWLPKLRKLSICGRNDVSCQALFRLMIGVSARQLLTTDNVKDFADATQKALLDQTNLPLLTIDIRHNTALNNNYVRDTIQAKCRDLPRSVDLSKLIAFVDVDTVVTADEVELCADGDPGLRVFERYPGL